MTDTNDALGSIAISACETIYNSITASQLDEIRRQGVSGIAISFAWEIGQQIKAERNALRLSPPSAQADEGRTVKAAESEAGYDPNKDPERRKRKHKLDHIDLPGVHLGKLRKAGILTLGQLADMQPEELLEIPGFTQAYLNRAGALLADRGLLRTAQ